MAIIRCPECQREVSDKAEKCIGCGAPLNGRPEPARSATVVIPTKSVGISIILTILFGPVGLFYSSVAGGIVMLLAALFLGLATLGIALIPIWLICVLWGALAVTSYNEKILPSRSVPQEPRQTAPPDTDGW